MPLSGESVWTTLIGHGQDEKIYKEKCRSSNFNDQWKQQKRGTFGVMQLETILWTYHYYSLYIAVTAGRIIS